MQTRKIHNYESVILVEETIAEYGYSPDKYGPASAKFVIATCRYCGKHHKIRKGFFNKAGSACHKKCKLEEQAFFSPMIYEEVRQKAKKTNLERYGVEHACQNLEIAKKISIVKSKNPSNITKKELYDWLISIGAKVSYNDRSVIFPLELDIVDKDKKVAVEFNGSFWHSEAFLDRAKAKNCHIHKMRECEAVGYRLVHIFEHTYLHHKDQVKNYLRSVFGLNEIKIGARKCIITHDNSNWFLNKYHIQGAPKGTTMFFNLVYDGEIVGCITAGKHHEKGGDSEACVLTRLVFRDNTTVQGGSSKLFSSLKKWAISSGYKKILSWSDNTISEGNIYDVLGFELEQEYDPSYFYFDAKNDRYCTKQSQRKTNKLRESGVSITDWNNSRSMYVIWDCGKKKWTYNIEEKKHCQDSSVIELMEKIRDNLSYDLVKEGYRGETPVHGSCYIASEAFYHLFGGGLEIKRYKLDNGIVHWWLERDGEVIDITREQFNFEIPYRLGRSCGFLTKGPSKRCKILMERVFASTLLS